MAVVSYPGVYVEEISGGARPIESSGTSTAAFVGQTEKGPDSLAVLVSSWDDYTRVFGGFISASYVAQSVFAYFNNGGRQCYVLRVTASDASRANVTIANRVGDGGGIIFVARDKGAWANALLLDFENGTDDPANEFKLILRRQSDADVAPTSDELAALPLLEVHDNLSVDPSARNFFGRVLAADSSLIDAMPNAANVSLQRGFHVGGEPRMRPTSNQQPLPPPVSNAINSFLISLDGDAYQEVVLALAATPTWNDLADDIVVQVAKLKPKRQSVSPESYKIQCTAEVVESATWSTPDNVVRYTRLHIVSGTAGAASAVLVQDAPARNIAGLLGLGSQNGGHSEGALAQRRPVEAAAVQLGDASMDGTTVIEAPIAGSDGSTMALNEQDHANAFTRLDGKSDVSLLCVPGIGTSTMFDLGTAYCQNRPLQDCFYVGEVGSECNEMNEALSFRATLKKANSYGALYFPWVLALDPSGRSSVPVILPPSGYIAGLFARIDNARGVWKAPAGTEASLNGVVGLTGELTDIEQGKLNPIGVNVIRHFNLAGIVSWGARTVTSDPEYRYVSVRRLAIMLRRSIYDGIQWAVFEPNNSGLWSALRLNIGSFMNGLFRAGAFQGSQSTDAYFVRCGLGDTMTQDDIDRGQVIVQVGFAPVKPAEFVIVRIQQKLGVA